MAERLIYFGGTFDPVHVGHVQIARALAAGVGASRVLLVPTGVNPLKPSPVASADDRLAMLQLATQDDDLFEICTLELYRTPPCYTIDTVELLRRQVSPETEIHLAIGADMLADLPKWRRVVELLGMVHLVVACRPPQPLQAVETALEHLSASMKKTGLASIRAQAIPTPLLEISSTDIRDRLSKGVPADPFVKKDVMDYIRRNGLYTTSEPSAPETK